MDGVVPMHGRVSGSQYLTTLPTPTSATRPATRPELKREREQRDGGGAADAPLAAAATPVLHAAFFPTLGQPSVMLAIDIACALGGTLSSALLPSGTASEGRVPPGTSAAANCTLGPARPWPADPTQNAPVDLAVDV